MKERPILFSAPMVRAILDERKSQTRRVVKPIPQMITDKSIMTWEGDAAALMRLFDQVGRTCPYGMSGDRLWVRETWQAACGDKRAARIVESPRPDFGWIEYAATCDDPPPRWRPSIHMPRWASRILLEVTAVRVERLNDISEADSRAEGCPWSDGAPDEHGLPTQLVVEAKDEFAHLWRSINGPGSWETNPWVWVIEFKKVTP